MSYTTSYTELGRARYGDRWLTAIKHYRTITGAMLKDALRRVLIEEPVIPFEELESRAEDARRTRDAAARERMREQDERRQMRHALQTIAQGLVGSEADIRTFARLVLKGNDVREAARRVRRGEAQGEE